MGLRNASSVGFLELLGVGVKQGMNEIMFKIPLLGSTPWKTTCRWVRTESCVIR